MCDIQYMQALGLKTNVIMNNFGEKAKRYVCFSVHLLLRCRLIMVGKPFTISLFAFIGVIVTSTHLSLITSLLTFLLTQQTEAWCAYDKGLLHSSVPADEKGLNPSAPHIG